MSSSKLIGPTRRSQFKRQFARYLRANPTKAERRLWSLLRDKQLAQLRFRRQQPLGPYVVDFFCAAAKLITELDGGQHSADTVAAYDAARSQWLEARGYRVLCFTNGELLRNSPDMLEKIWLASEDRLPFPEPHSAVRPSLKGRVE